MTTFAGLRANALSPSLIADRVPDGVLRDVGLAAWEMPPTSTGGGYMHGLRAANHADYGNFLLPALRTSPLLYQLADMQALATAMFGAAGSMTMADLPTVYGRGTSMALQNTVLAPTRTGTVDSFYDYEPDLDAIIADWGGRRLYVHIGVANNNQFPTGSFRFNNQYGVECRQGENTYRAYVDATTFGIAPTRFVASTPLFTVDATTKEWPATIYDTTHPAVVALDIASIGAMVGTYGTQLRYVVHGEAGNTFPRPGSNCIPGPLTDQCDACDPATNYAAHAITGFRSYLLDVLGLDLAQIQTRWGVTLADPDDIDPSVARFCPTLSVKALEDWMDFQRYLLHEQGLAEYHAAKANTPAAIVGLMKFTEYGQGRSALVSDIPASADWYGQSSDAYRAAQDYQLESVGASARLGGAGPIYFVSAPPTIPVADPQGQGAVPKILRSFRTYTTDEVRWFFRDVLTGTAAHIGYLKAPTVAFGAHAASVTAVLDEVDEIVAMHDSHLAMSGPWQRFAIHSERLEWFSASVYEDGSARVAYHLHKRLRSRAIPSALFGDERMLARTHSTYQLERSLVVVPFHSRVDDMLTAYGAIMPEAGPGAALIVDENPGAVAELPGSLPAGVDDTVLLRTNRGTLFRWHDGAANATNAFYFATLPARACAKPDTHFARIALVVDQQVIPEVETYTTGYLASPVSVAAASGNDAPIAINWVTDGVNFTVAVSNMAADSDDVTVSIDASVATALDVTHAPQVVTLAAGETQYLLFEGVGDLDSVDILAALDLADANLTTLEALGAYDTAAGRECIDRGRDLLTGNHLGRALAAYTAAVRMVYLLATYASGPDEVTVTARRIGIDGEAATLPVSGARVQLLWPLNGREEGADGTTDGSGECVLVAGDPLDLRWDFAAGELGSPGSGALVEVVVTAQDYGTTSRVTLAL